MGGGGVWLPSWHKLPNNENNELRQNVSGPKYIGAKSSCHEKSIGARTYRRQKRRAKTSQRQLPKRLYQNGPVPLKVQEKYNV